MSIVVLFCLRSASSPTSLTDIVLNQNRPKYSTNLNKGSTDPLRTFQWTFQRLKCPMFHSLFSKTDNVLVVKQWLNNVNTSLPNTVSKWSPALSNHFYMGKKKKNTFLLGLTVILDTCLLSFCFFNKLFILVLKLPKKEKKSEGSTEFLYTLYPVSTVIDIFHLYIKLSQLLNYH